MTLNINAIRALITQSFDGVTWMNGLGITDGTEQLLLERCASLHAI